jgi:hypothetical protein
MINIGFGRIFDALESESRNEGKIARRISSRETM